MNELIYIVWVAVGTTGYWEAAESIQRLRGLKWVPKWTWPSFSGMVPIAWMALIQISDHPFNLFIYGVISVVYMGILQHYKRSMWNSFSLFILQLLLFLLLPEWRAQADRFIIMMMVEAMALGFYAIKRNPVWALFGIAIWVVMKPIFFPAHDQINDLIDLVGIFIPLFLYSKEISRRIRIVFERNHDPLTGLLNRMSFNDEMKEMEGAQGALMVIDLDDFKYVNDTLGHQAGDNVLIEVGKMVTQVIPEKAKVFRWGGDEFVIVCPEVKNAQVAQDLAQEIHRQISKEAKERKGKIGCQMSMGVAFGLLTEELFTKADIALIHVKRIGKHRVACYQDVMENIDHFKESSVNFEKILVHQRDVRIADAVWEYAFEGMLVTDLEGTILRINRMFSLVTGYTPEETIGKNPRILQSGTYLPSFYHDMWRQIIEKGMWQGKIANRKKSGEIYEEWLQIRTVKDETGSPLYYLATFTFDETVN